MEFISKIRETFVPDMDKTAYYELLEELEKNRIESHSVNLHNDDKTTMGFVMKLFLLFQDVEIAEAKARMMKIHESENGILIKTNENLSKKVQSFVAKLAEQELQPLKVTVNEI